jgi:DNA invertase Pin-like site-specific DNA recombinase
MMTKELHCPKAYSYVRFSTPEQQRGDSFRRQTEAAKVYAQEHDLELDGSLELHDLGVSAFRGANIRGGALGRFRRAVEDGEVAEGSYLLVENLDRFSRANPWEALPLFQDIVNAGITIVTLQDRKVYSSETLRENRFLILESIFTMIRANEESETKAKRVHEAWAGSGPEPQKKASR